MSDYARFDDVAGGGVNATVESNAKPELPLQLPPNLVGSLVPLATIQSLHPSAASALAASRQHIARRIQWLYKCLLAQLILAGVVLILGSVCTIRSPLPDESNPYF